MYRHLGRTTNYRLLLVQKVQVFMKFNLVKYLQFILVGEMRQVSLNSSEDLYQEIRWLNFNAVGPSLSRKARSISAQFQERHEAKTVREMKEFVEKLPSMQVTF